MTQSEHFAIVIIMFQQHGLAELVNCATGLLEAGQTQSVLEAFRIS